MGDNTEVEDDNNEYQLRKGSLPIKARLFEGRPDIDKNQKYALIFLVVFIILFVLTCGLVIIPLMILSLLIMWRFSKKHKKRETIVFNNDLKLLETPTLGEIDYTQIRIAGIFDSHTHSVYTAIYAEGVLPPQPKGLRETNYLPVGPEDPIYVVPMKHGRVDNVQDTVQRIAEFTQLPTEEPSIAWSQIQSVISTEVLY